MFTKFGILCALLLIGVQNIDPVSCQPGATDLQQGFTTRCDELCSNEIQEVTNSLPVEVVMMKSIQKKNLCAGFATRLSERLPVLQH